MRERERSGGRSWMRRFSSPAARFYGRDMGSAWKAQNGGERDGWIEVQPRRRRGNEPVERGWDRRRVSRNHQLFADHQWLQSRSVSRGDIRSGKSRDGVFYSRREDSRKHGRFRSRPIMNFHGLQKRSVGYGKGVHAFDHRDRLWMDGEFSEVSAQERRGGSADRGCRQDQSRFREARLWSDVVCENRDIRFKARGVVVRGQDIGGGLLPTGVAGWIWWGTEGGWEDQWCDMIVLEKGMSDYPRSELWALTVI